MLSEQGQSWNMVAYIKFRNTQSGINRYMVSEYVYMQHRYKNLDGEECSRVRRQFSVYTSVVLQERPCLPFALLCL